MSIMIKTVVICDDCGNEHMGYKTMYGSPHKVAARESARSTGWKTAERCGTPIRNQVDRCPECRRKHAQSSG